MRNENPFLFFDAVKKNIEYHESRHLRHEMSETLKYLNFFSFNFISEIIKMSIIYSF